MASICWHSTRSSGLSADIEKRVHLTLRELDIEDAASKLAGKLSGGRAKRVGIARAVVTELQILLYDEPTAGIDLIRRARSAPELYAHHGMGLGRGVGLTADRPPLIGQQALRASSGSSVYQRLE